MTTSKEWYSTHHIGKTLMCEHFLPQPQRGSSLDLSDEVSVSIKISLSGIVEHSCGKRGAPPIMVMWDFLYLGGLYSVIMVDKSCCLLKLLFV